MLKEESQFVFYNDDTFYEVEHTRGKFIIYKDRLELFKEYSELPFIVKCDETNMEEFNLEGYEFSSKSYECKLVLRCAKIVDSFTTDVEILIFDIDKIIELRKVINYLNGKLQFRKSFVEKFGNTVKMTEEERKYGKNRFSNIKIKECIDNKRLKACYYGVEVQGVKYRDLDITKIPVDKEVAFEFEPTNEYDKKAIKILCNDIFIGYVPKRNIQSIFKKYIVGESKYIYAFVSKVDEEQKRIFISVGMYDEIDDNAMQEQEFYDFKLIRTNRRDRYLEDTYRQDNLLCVKENDKVFIEYDESLGTYVVEYGGLELGEIGRPDSKKLLGYQNVGNKLESEIIKLETKDDMITCTIRVFVL